MKLFNHEDKPVIEGRLLTLACLAKGSGKMKFLWYKDGMNVSVHKTSRNLWETRINNTETQMSILNIDKANVLDEGTGFSVMIIAFTFTNKLWQAKCNQQSSA